MKLHIFLLGVVHGNLLLANPKNGCKVARTLSNPKLPGEQNNNKTIILQKNFLIFMDEIHHKPLDFFAF